MTKAVGKNSGCCVSGVELGSWEGVGVVELVGSGENTAVTLDILKRTTENNSAKIKVSVSAVLFMSALSFTIFSFQFSLSNFVTSFFSERFWNVCACGVGFEQVARVVLSACSAAAANLTVLADAALALNVALVP